MRLPRRRSGLTTTCRVAVVFETRSTLSHETVISGAGTAALATVKRARSANFMALTDVHGFDAQQGGQLLQTCRYVADAYGAMVRRPVGAPVSNESARAA